MNKQERERTVAGLSEEDEAALDRSESDLSDIPQDFLDAARRRQRSAYDLAQRIVDGTVDPLMA